jgi:hypothetical protein
MVQGKRDHQEGPKDNPNDPNDQHGREGNTNPETKLVLPYDDVLDKGDRPIPGTFVSWLSQALQISVEGVPYVGGTLPRDRPTTVKIKIANLGNRDANALVSLYWTDPTALFSTSNLKADGLSEPVWVYVPANAITETSAITLKPPASLPDHVCLIAEITSGEPSAPGLLDPVNNRHYAQHNINLEHVDEGRLTGSSFQINNPFHSDATIRLQIRPAPDEVLKILEGKFRADTRSLSPRALAIRQGVERDRSLGQREISFEMAEKEHRLCQAIISAEGLQSGGFAACEVRATAVSRANQGQEKEYAGSIGIVVFANKK